MQTAMRQQCTDCAYIYEPDKHNGIPLSDRSDWECPGLEGNCGATVDRYEIIDPISPLSDEETMADGDDTYQDSIEDLHPEVIKPTRVDKAVRDLVSMYDEGELILQPDWQRYYVWTNKQASQLVESLFLRLPIPIIYLNEEEDGNFTVIDGQQRLTALIEFVKNSHVDPMRHGDIILSGLESLEHYNKKKFTDLSSDDQKWLRKQTLSIVTLKPIKDPELKLRIFRRLNTGSVALNAQELRNAAFRGPYNSELKKWATNPTFRKLIGKTSPDLRMYDVELVLRFSAWVNRGWTSMKSKNLGKFLDKEMEFGKSYKSNELNKIGQQFKNAVDLTFSTFGPERAFRRYVPGLEDSKKPSATNGVWETRQINKALYDVVMFGFTRFSKSQIFPHIEAIREELLDLMATDPKFQDSITAGTTDPKRIDYRFSTWDARLKEIVSEDAQKRTFSRDLKKKLFAQSPTCAICGQEITDIDDAHVHHVKHYWRGGQTIPENAALTHRFCNMSEGGGKS
jgi:hypothetical protein